VTVLDWGIIAFTVVLAIWGFRQGLIVGAMTLIGFGAGAFAGSRLGPLVLSGGAESPYAPLVAALMALLVGASAAVAFEGLALGLRGRLVHGRPRLQLVDGASGAILIAAVALGMAWVFGAVALHAPGAGQLRADVQQSVILRNLNQLLPPSGPILHALNRVDPAPSILGPAPPLARPDPAIVDDPNVQQAGQSVLRVLGTACGLGVEGSGWVVAPGLVVTNAHVVAGEDDTSVSTQEGASFDAVAVYYDPRNDLALLHFDADIAPLALAPRSSSGSGAAVLGYPENGPYTATPARLGTTRAVLTEDAYGRGPIRRTIASLRGSVRSGDSGGPVVDSRGRVLATVFAATTSGPTGGFAVPNGVVERALERVASPVDTGPCTG
jgi:S1-C subfamily serine protease